MEDSEHEKLNEKLKWSKEGLGTRDAAKGMPLARPNTFKPLVRTWHLHREG